MRQTHSPSVALLGLPFDANSSYLRGPAMAPRVIRRALYCDSSNLWTEDGIDLGVPDVITDTGDLEIVPAPEDTSLWQVTSAISAMLEQGLRPIALGGDHSLTYPIVRGFAQHFSNLNILHFDAHPDLYDEFEGNRFSHACPFARIMEEKLAARLVQVGIRTMNRHQREQAERFGVEVIEMRALQDGLKLCFDSPLYISFDMDALDPAFAPGVSHHEPGGLSTRQALSLIQSVEAPQIAGADIVEFNPTRDTHTAQEIAGRIVPAPESLGITAMAAAKILKEIAARMLV